MLQKQTIKTTQTDQSEGSGIEEADLETVHPSSIFPMVTLPPPPHTYTHPQLPPALTEPGLNP